MAFQFPTVEIQGLTPAGALVCVLLLSDGGKGKFEMEDSMIIISIFGGLVMGGVAFTILKRLGRSFNSHNKELHIV